MESVVTDMPLAWRDRSVFLTGHTGFKGSWLSLWLHRLGAKVHGYALAPCEPSLFDVARVAPLLASDWRADLADLDTLQTALQKAAPSVIFHLAAQPLVRESYRDPLGTLRTNVLGTAHLLQAARTVESIRAIVVVTTDKVYKNHGERRAYRELDPLGGHDPYSASKAAAEIITASFRSSFFSESDARIATARAGNVIGGGDWALDRLVPDCLRAFAAAQPVHLRYPNAVRPWQHVLEPLAGYLLLAEKLLTPQGGEFADAWNFGPRSEDNADVRSVAESLARLWGQNAQLDFGTSLNQPHEASLLTLNSAKAELLGWRPRWTLQQALEMTVAWQQSWHNQKDMQSCSLAQIESYTSAGDNE
jgi:CDP-glucose 4,6-dehydratase